MSDFYYLRKSKNSTTESAFSGVYHVLGPDGKTALCNMAKAGVNSFAVVKLPKPALTSLTCYNCRLESSRSAPSSKARRRNRKG